MNETDKENQITRYEFQVCGRVQGVGFRPFLYRLANQFHLAGWIANHPEGVVGAIEGPNFSLQQFIKNIKTNAPSASRVEVVKYETAPIRGENGFTIRDSFPQKSAKHWPAPDLGPCEECCKELRDPSNRRYQYPFIHCTQCGPRYTISERNPFDRAHTTMKHFIMCELCSTEYHNPTDRRFQSQTNACPQCGPQLELWDSQGNVLAKANDALLLTIKALKNNAIVAVKGVGGFHLMAKASSQKSVEILRIKKHRPTKPFALLYPSLESVERDCLISPIERRLLSSNEGPIVLVERRLPRTEIPTPEMTLEIDEGVAPHTPYLGVFLPSNPLHLLITEAVEAPLIATSGNFHREPMITDEQLAIRQLNEIAQYFLVNNRPISHFVEDSIIRVVCGSPLFLRRSRGYAPFAISLPRQSFDSANDHTDVNHSPKTALTNPHTPSILAGGGHLKNTTALGVGDTVWVSPHLGDLISVRTREAWGKSIAHWTENANTTPNEIAVDLHPHYSSTQEAKRLSFSLCSVQHHHAHALSCLIDNQFFGNSLGVTWDGSGFGTDGTIWGGEFLKISPTGFERFACFLPFALPGGESAIRDGRKCALSVLYEACRDRKDLESVISSLGFSPKEHSLVWHLLTTKGSSPKTSSVGRLFDAFSAIFGLCATSSFEGEAAAQVEFAAMSSQCRETYPFHLIPGTIYQIDWRPMVVSALQDREQRVPVPDIMAKFHHTLVAITARVAELSQQKTLALSGGVFQNRLLVEAMVEKLEPKGFRVLRHRDLPPNDGGLAVGQIAALRGKLLETASCA